MKTKRLITLLLASSLVLSLSACGDPDVPGATGAQGGGVDAGADPAGTRQCEVPPWDGEGTPPPPEMYEGCLDAPVDGPEEPVSNEPGGPVAEVPHPRPSSVHPKPGQENVHPIGWDKSQVSKNGRSVDVIFWSGVEPCYVLDRVEVEYRADKVVITLFQGSTPMEEEVACIDIALQKMTTVELEEPLNGREIVDGAS